MRICEQIGCKTIPCSDMRHECYSVPATEIDPQRVTVVLISESAPAKFKDDYYALREPLFAQTTLLAFSDAGVHAGSIHQLDLFPNVHAYLLMGDVAIQAINEINRRAGAGRAIPAGSTYKIRGPEYYFRGGRAFPSYLQAGHSFGIEKSKRGMIAEDIAVAMVVDR